MHPPTDGSSNSKTLVSYERHFAEYIDQTSQEVTGAAKEWIDAALDGVPLQASILELGSGFGRDAAYIESKGFRVECSDAAGSFVSHLRNRGLRARLFNVITDELMGTYNLVLANAVMLHFTECEFALVLAKLYRALKAEGRLAISLKRGQGEAWSNEKLGAPRFFRYWEVEGLEPLLAGSCFARWTIASVSTHPVHADWLFAIAYKS